MEKNNSSAESIWVQGLNLGCFIFLCESSVLPGGDFFFIVTFFEMLYHRILSLHHKFKKARSSKAKPKSLNALASLWRNLGVQRVKIEF